MSRSKTRLACAATCLLAFATSFAQPAPPAAPRLPLPPMEPAAGSVQTLSGRLQQWLVNPNGEVDGLLLDDGTQVGFPPHLSARLLQSVSLKDSLQVTGWRSAGAPVMRASLIRSSTRGTSVADEPPPPGAAPRAPVDAGSLTAMSASGRVTRVLYGPQGEARGAIVSGGTIVRFPPHVGAALGTTLAVGQPLYARGFGTRTDHGSAFEATAIGATLETARETFGPPGPLADARGLPPLPVGMPPPPLDGAARPADGTPPPNAATRPASAPR